MPEPGSLGGGFTAGVLQTQLDLQAIQEGQQNIQLNQFKISEAPIKLQEEAVKLQSDKLELQKAMTLMQKLHGFQPGQGGTPADLSSEMYALATMQMESGYVDAGAQTANRASLIQARASQVDYRSYRQSVDRMSRFANILGGVPESQQGWATAIQDMIAQDPSVVNDPKFVAMAQRPYQQGMVAGVRAASLTAKEQAEIKYRSQAGDHAEAAAAADRARIPFIRAQTAKAEQYVKDHGKEGSTTVKASELQAITDLANAEFPGSDPADVRARSRPVAEEMKRMMRDNGLSLSQAAHEAYARNRLAFAGLHKGASLPGSVPGKAIALKPGMNPQQNQWYEVEGQPQIRIGDNFYTEEELKKLDKESAEITGDDDGDEE